VPQPLELGGVDAGAGAAGIDQPSIRIVISEQQRAEIRPPSFGISPADHDKFLAVEAFDLEPDAAIAGRIGRIGAFRNDALEIELAGVLVEGRAPAPVIVAVVQGRADIRQQFGQPRLALDQRQGGNILGYGAGANSCLLSYCICAPGHVQGDEGRLWIVPLTGSLFQLFCFRALCQSVVAFGELQQFGARFC
jgi:hypothetical protein